MDKSLSQQTDEGLMELYKSGNELAFNVLYERYSPKVYGFLRKRVQNPQVARDLFQRVFLKLHQSRDLFDPSLPFSPWIFTITRNSLLDWRKSQGREGKKISEFEAEPSAAADGKEGLTIDLKVVPEIQRAAIELRYFEELPYEQIAQRLDTSPANVRQLVSRGISRLRKAFHSGRNHEE